jgi:hypothetical protein
MYVNNINNLEETQPEEATTDCDQADNGAGHGDAAISRDCVESDPPVVTPCPAHSMQLFQATENANAQQRAAARWP